MPVTLENNDSLRYLRKCGNNWEYDESKVHEKLKIRLLKRFDSFDKDKDAMMTMEEVTSWADRMKMLCNASDEECDRMREAIRILFGGMGVTEEGLSRDDWVEANQTFAEAEFERERRGEQSHVALLNDAYFDVLDEDGNGTVSFDELETMMKAFAIPVEAAVPFFAKADIDGDGALQREEMHNLFNKFWLHEYDSSLDGIYANYY